MSEQVPENVNRLLPKVCHNMCHKLFLCTFSLLYTPDKKAFGISYSNTIKL